VTDSASKPLFSQSFLTLFDIGHYRRQTGCTFDEAAEALHHFRSVGDASGLDPSPYFATRWYKERYPDWPRGGQTAVEDFLGHLDRGQGRRPHPLFDPEFYLGTYPDLAKLAAGAVLHFIRHGDSEGRAPSSAFDAGFYRRCYLPLGVGHPFRHYVTEGCARGYLPRPKPKSAEDSAQAMRKALTGTARPLLLVAHDAQAAGVPILTLDLAQALQARGFAPVFVLGAAGPLLDRFLGLGPVFLHAEGWAIEGLAAGLPPGTPTLVNTAAAAGLAVPLAQAGLRCLVLIHETADYVREHGFLPDLRAAREAGAGLIVSMPRMAQAMAEDPGGIEWVRPGIVLPRTTLAAFRQRRQERRAGPVFIGAGHADRRKGFDLFLEAAAQLARDLPGARFVWLGALDVWARALADTALADGLDLTLPGFVEDSLAWYRAADVYLLTSRQDPGPTTVIHAAAVGTPFVGYAADIGLIGLAEAAGQFVAPGDLAAFTTTARRLARDVTPATRWRLRRKVRAATGFEPYVGALISRLTCVPDGAT